ncbi:MAG: [Lachnospiraceae bacterium]|nr:[citrate (pro-3S)-lyase] ligase [Lachnospiraceae bacterium]
MTYPIYEITKAERALLKERDALLLREGIEKDPLLDYSAAAVDPEDHVIATGSLFRNTIRCLAVAEEYHGEGLTAEIVRHLLSVERSRGFKRVFLYTKPENETLLISLGFHAVASAGNAVFMENDPSGFSRWVDSLPSSGRKNAAVVMNANPFTLGHRFLVEKALEAEGSVTVFVVEEENGPIPFSVRIRLVREGLKDLKNVAVLPSGPYIISHATFPTYFLHGEDDAVRAHAAIDLAVFRKISAALGIVHRFIGEEPANRVTALYNEVMVSSLRSAGIKCTVVKRLETGDKIISAGAVRK